MEDNGQQELLIILNKLWNDIKILENEYTKAKKCSKKSKSNADYLNKKFIDIEHLYNTYKEIYNFPDQARKHYEYERLLSKLNKWDSELYDKSI